MKKQREEEERYFQTIARRFFQLRGAPFFLSAKEIVLVESWREQDIPLVVVLEGMRTAYESHKRRPYRKGRAFSLTFCHNHVVRALSQYRERRVGRRARTPYQPSKLERVKAECESFLQQVPDQVHYLKDVYTRILDEYSQGRLDESRLEEFEQEIETLIVNCASPQEKDAATREVRAEFHVPDPQEWMRVFHIKLIKNVRERYRIPYVSPFHY